MLLLWVLTLTRVTYLGRLDKVPVFLCPSKGESAVFGLSGSCWWLRTSLSFSSSSSSMVPGRRNSFCGSSMPLISALHVLRINPHWECETHLPTHSFSPFLLHLFSLPLSFLSLFLSFPFLIFFLSHRFASSTLASPLSFSSLCLLSLPLFLSSLYEVKLESGTATVFFVPCPGWMKSLEVSTRRWLTAVGEQSSVFCHRFFVSSHFPPAFTPPFRSRNPTIPRPYGAQSILCVTLLKWGAMYTSVVTK